VSAFLLLAALAAVAYQVAVLVAAWNHLKRQEPKAKDPVPVAVLKPIYGRDPNFEANLRSHFEQDYPDYELLFGVRAWDHESRSVLERLQQQYPAVRARVIVCEPRTANQKVGVLAELTRHTSRPVLVVNDSDIQVDSDYLREVTAPLEDPAVGLVTCLYRANSEHFPGKFEALGVATDFAAGVLVAPWVGVRGFGLGATLAFRREQLEQIGGFEGIADYLADDYELGRRIAQAGYRVHLSRAVVTTWLPGRSWREVWRHQVRWQRTIRACQGPGYLGLLVTHATVWALVAAGAGQWRLAALIFGARVAAGLASGIGVLGCPVTRRYWYWMPLRDLFGFAVWVAAWISRWVEWRGQLVRLDRQGRIVEAVQLFASQDRS